MLMCHMLVMLAEVDRLSCMLWCRDQSNMHGSYMSGCHCFGSHMRCTILDILLPVVIGAVTECPHCETSLQGRMSLGLNRKPQNMFK